MNAFATAAAEAAAAPADEGEVTHSRLVQLFLEGRDGSSGTFTAANGVLSEDEDAIARLTPDGTTVLASNYALSDLSMNDALIAGTAISGRTLRRVDGFSRLTNTADRVRELDAGKFEDFRAVSSLFNFQATDEELASLEKARAFRERVNAFFTDLDAKEKARLKAERARTAKERAAKAAIAWDDGTGQAINSNVQGEGGGQRLRVAKTGKARVETSTGYTLTQKQAERAWNFATKYWHGGKEIPNDSWNNRRAATLAARSYGGYATEVRENAIHFGCQRVTRQEAERFADVMGWDRAEKTA